MIPGSPRCGSRSSARRPASRSSAAATGLNLALAVAPGGHRDERAVAGDATRLGQGRAAVAGELHPVEGGDDVEHVVGPRQILDRFDPEIRVRDAAAGGGDHRLGVVDPGHGGAAVRSEGQELPAAAPQIEHRRAGRERGGRGDHLARRVGERRPRVLPQIHD
jgi:hypothetical protein